MLACKALHLWAAPLRLLGNKAAELGQSLMQEFDEGEWLAQEFQESIPSPGSQSGNVQETKRKTYVKVYIYLNLPADTRA